MQEFSMHWEPPKICLLLQNHRTVVGQGEVLVQIWVLAMDNTVALSSAYFRSGVNWTTESTHIVTSLMLRFYFLQNTAGLAVDKVASREWTNQRSHCQVSAAFVACSTQILYFKQRTLLTRPSMDSLTGACEPLFPNMAPEPWLQLCEFSDNMYNLFCMGHNTKQLQRTLHVIGSKCCIA